MTTEQFASLAVTTLNGSMDNSQTSAVVLSATRFPSSAQYRIQIDTELMLVTAGAGTTTWTVTRGTEGTSAASHVSGSRVTHVLTAAALGGQSDPASATPGLRTLDQGNAGSAASATALTAETARAMAAEAAETSRALGIEALKARVFGLNVQDFGAVGDGSADDTAALAAWVAALNASTTGAIGVIPSGQYLTTAPLPAITQAGVKIFGAGHAQTAFTKGSVISVGASWSNTAAMVRLAGEGCELNGVMIDGQGTPTTLITVSAANCRLLDIGCHGVAAGSGGVPNVCVDIVTGGVSCWITDSRINGINFPNTGIQVNDTDAIIATSKPTNNTHNIVLLLGASGTQILDNHMTPGSNGQTCIYVNGQPSHVQISGNRFDNYVRSGIQLTPPSSSPNSMHIIDNHFFSNVQTDNTYAHIALDTTLSGWRGLHIVGNSAYGSSSHRAKYGFAAQALDGTTPTNTSRLTSYGSLFCSNTMWAATSMFAADAPSVARGNMTTTDGLVYTTVPDSAVTTLSVSGLTGATAASRYAGATASGAPVSGSFLVGDFVVDQTGVLWICTVAGSPGTWVSGSGAVTSVAGRTGAVVIAESDVTSLVSDLALKAPLASPVLTGNPTVPTQGPLTNSTRAASTAYADAAVAVEASRAASAEALLSPIASPTFIGIVTAPEYSASGLTGATALSRYVGATASGAPVSGTFAVGDFVVDRTGSIWICTTLGTPGTWTQIVAGSVSLSADLNFNSHKGTSVTAGVAVDDIAVLGQALEQYRMTQRGFTAWSFDPDYAAAGSTATSQTLYVVKVPLPLNKTYSITGCTVAVTSAVNTPTTGQNLITLYNQAGTKQADTADQSGVWTTAGTYAANFTGGPYSIVGGLGNYCWVSFLSNGSTGAAFAVAGTRLAYNAISTGIGTGATLFCARNGTAVTSTATITVSSNVNTASLSYWVGLF